MTKALKRRFIIFTMTAVTFLLIFIILAVNGLNWAMLEHQSDRVLDVLVQSEGVFHKMNFNRPPHLSPPMNMDKMRSSRFFIVKSDSTNKIIDINTEQISSVDFETAKQYAIKVFETNKTSGKIDGYKFAVKQIGDNRLIFFADLSLQRENFFTTLFASSAIAIICWILLLIIVFLLSGKVIRPVIIGIEKQKQFITNAGHEMKTPLAIIQSNNDTMALIHGENKYNTHIGAQTKRLNALMSNLLTLAKLDEDISLPKEAVNISELTKEILPVYNEYADVKNFNFNVSVEPNIAIHTNKDAFLQILYVLLDNAFKYTSNNGNIFFSLSKIGKKIQIIEENTCDTPSCEDPEKLFERFYRGDLARTQSQDCSGYGIGLSAARAICENFGGKMTAEYTSAQTIRFIAKF